MDKRPQAVLAENLMRLRHANRFTQKQLAKKAGLGEGTIHRASDGKQSAATLETIEALAEAFNLEPWQLLVPDLNPESPPRLQRNHFAADVLWIAKEIAARPSAKAFFMEQFDRRKTQQPVDTDHRVIPFQYREG